MWVGREFEFFWGVVGLAFDWKTVDCLVIVDLSGIEEGGRELGFVWWVGEELGFEAKAISGLVDMSFFSGFAVSEVVGGVELYAWHGGKYFKASSAWGVKYLCRFD